MKVIHSPDRAEKVPVEAKIAIGNALCRLHQRSRHYTKNFDRLMMDVYDVHLDKFAMLTVSSTTYQNMKISLVKERNLEKYININDSQNLIIPCNIDFIYPRVCKYPLLRQYMTSPLKC